MDNYFNSSSSNKKTSSIDVLSVKEICLASLSEGLYFHFSRKTIVSLLTHTRLARSS